MDYVFILVIYPNILNDKCNIFTLSPLNSLMPWSVVFHCLASHEHSSWRYDLQSNEKLLTTDHVCWYMYFNEKSCNEEF